MTDPINTIRHNLSAIHEHTGGDCSSNFRAIEAAITKLEAMRVPLTDEEIERVADHEHAEGPNSGSGMWREGFADGLRYARDNYLAPAPQVSQLIAAGDVYRALMRDVLLDGKVSALSSLAQRIMDANLAWDAAKAQADTRPERVVTHVCLQGEQSDPCGTMRVSVRYSDGSEAEVIKDSGNSIYHTVSLDSPDIMPFDKRPGVDEIVGVAYKGVLDWTMATGTTANRELTKNELREYLDYLKAKLRRRLLETGLFR